MGEKSTDRTDFECARNSPHSPLTVGTHKRTEQSLDADAISLPEGEKLVSSTASLWP